MTDSAPVTVVEFDLLCRRCGYNLRSLALTGVCPECATPVAQSAGGNLLRNADPEWLLTVRRGASLKLWNLVLVFLVSAAAGILVSAGFPTVFAAMAGLVGGALGLWATFLITTQEPRIALQEDAVTLRKVIRTCAVAAFAGGMLQYAQLSGTWGTAFQVAAGVFGLVGMVVAWGELLYFRRFAVRIPDDKLARSTALLMWVAPITGGVAIAFGVVAGIVAASRAGGPGATTAAVPAPVGMVLPVMVCGLFAFGLYMLLWYIRLLVRYRKAFATAAEEARAISAGGATGRVVQDGPHV